MLIHICCQFLFCFIWFAFVQLFIVGLSYYVAKPNKIIIFALTYVLEILTLLYGDFGMNLNGVDSDEAIKHKFLRSVKCFTASL
jgi:hypothetical protein